jgi:hypothetical protein
MWPIPWSAGPYRDIGIKRNKRSELAYYSSPIRLGSAFAFKFDAIHVEKPFTAILQTRRRLRREGDIGATPPPPVVRFFEFLRGGLHHPNAARRHIIIFT